MKPCVNYLSNRVNHFKREVIVLKENRNQKKTIMEKKSTGKAYSINDNTAGNDKKKETNIGDNNQDEHEGEALRINDNMVGDDDAPATKKEEKKADSDQEEHKGNSLRINDNTAGSSDS